MKIGLASRALAIAAIAIWLHGCTIDDETGGSLVLDAGNLIDASSIPDGGAGGWDAGQWDAAYDGLLDAERDAARDGDVLDAAFADAGVDAALADAGPDAASDAATDAALDAALDGSTDAALDGSTEGPVDAANDGAMDAAGDAARDAEPDAASDAGSCSDCCADGFPRGVKGSGPRLVRAFTPSPEGVTVCPSGDVFVALDGSGEIWRVSGSGAAAERWASVGARRPAGLSCDAQGRLFVAIFSVSGGNGAPSLAMISGKDQPAVMLPAPTGAALTGLNGVLAIAGLGVYATDSSTGRVVRWAESTPGTFSASVVANNAPGANGLAFNPRTRKLYVAGSFEQLVYSYSVGSDGSIGARATAFRGNELAGFFDGVAVDANGALYAASYLAGKVVRSPDNTLVGGIANPASLAFRGGTLFVTDYKVLSSSAAGGLYAIDLGVCGPTP